MRAPVLRLLSFPLVVLVVPLVVSLSSAACSSRVQDCAELGPDWTSCDGADAGPAVPNMCVLKAQKKVACTAAGGQATSSPTSPAVTEAGTKCSVFEPNLCGGKCVNVQSDEDHCGVCDNPCFTGESCLGGECR